MNQLTGSLFLPHTTPLYVKAIFDVSKTGRISNVEIIEAAPSDDKKFISSVTKKIRSSVFRPRFEGINPVDSKGVGQKFIFPIEWLKFYLK